MHMPTPSASPLARFWVTALLYHSDVLLPMADSSMGFRGSGYVIYVHVDSKVCLISIFYCSFHVPFEFLVQV